MPSPLFFQSTSPPQKKLLGKVWSDSECNLVVIDHCLREPEPTNFNFTVLSWNVDGLDGRNILERTRHICHIINSRKPDVAFLQEVIRDTLPVYQSKCPGWVIIVMHGWNLWFSVLANASVTCHHCFVQCIDVLMTCRLTHWSTHFWDWIHYHTL